MTNGKFKNNFAFCIDVLDNFMLIAFLILSFKGRKFTIDELRKRMSKRTERFMRVKQDKFYDELSMKELVSEYQRISEPLDETLSIDNLRLILKTLHRQRFCTIRRYITLTKNFFDFELTGKFNRGGQWNCFVNLFLIEFL